MSALEVLVLMGGPDAEAAVSMKSGEAVAKALRGAGLTVHEQVIDQLTLDSLAAFSGDVIFPVLHGPWGEGGPLQEMLEQDGRPFVGTGSVAAKKAMNKHTTKEVAQAIGVPTPPWVIMEDAGPLPLPLPVAIKPINEGSSVGVRLALTEEEAQSAMEEGLAAYGRIMLEKLIRGREITAGWIEGQRVPLIEIKPASGHYDFAAKYERPDTTYQVHPELPVEWPQQMHNATDALCRSLGLRDLARADFLVDEHGPWLLEVNTMPGFTAQSLLPQAAAASGMPMPTLCRHLVQRAADRTQN